VTETWLLESTQDAILALQDYTLFRHDRKGKGGGVLIAVSRQLKARQLPSNMVVEAVTV